MGRLKQHLRDRHNGSWDRFSVYLTEHDGHMKELESLLLRIAAPTGNKQTGKFVRSENLHLSLNRGIKEIDDDRRALLLGGQVARRRTRAKTNRSQGKAALARVGDRAIRLKGTLKDYEYSATLHTDGRVSYGGKMFNSPSAAAKDAIGRSSNGWYFWKYKNEKGEWVRLRELRR